MSDEDSNLTESINEVDRFILLLLRAAGLKPISGALWLQKEMFLLQEVFAKLRDETDFEPYLMGPYSEVVNCEAEELTRSGLVEVENGRISLTTRGVKMSESLSKKASKHELTKIEEFKDFLNDLSKDELLAFIYFSYPIPAEIAKESAEYKDIVLKRKKLALSLFQKNKISAQKAAQIAGEGIEDFIQNLKRVRECAG